MTKSRRWPSVVTAAVGGLVAVSAIAGGTSLATGIEGDRFPLRWLEGTPFVTYLVPGLILALAVGGSSAAAAVLAVLRTRWAPAVSLAAGVILAGWLIGEVVLLPPAAHSVTELVYFAAGATLVFAGVAAMSGRVR